MHLHDAQSGLETEFFTCLQEPIGTIYQPPADRLYLLAPIWANFFDVLPLTHELSTAHRIFLALSSGPEFFYALRKPDETDCNPV